MNCKPGNVTSYPHIKGRCNQMHTSDRIFLVFLKSLDPAYDEANQCDDCGDEE